MGRSCSREDAGALGIEDGDPLVIESPRGAIEAPARVKDIRPGTVFVPFHYGFELGGERLAATIT